MSVAVAEPSELNRLRWKCRRGMKELDTLLLYYLEQHYLDSSETQKKAFEILLDMQDPELYFLVLGKTSNNDKDISAIVSILQNTTRS